MRSHLRHAQWLLAALVCASSCQVSHGFDAAAAEASPADASQDNAHAGDAPPASAMLELEAARCLRYRRQHAYEAAPGPRSPNGRDAEPAPSSLSRTLPPSQPADAQLVVNTPQLAQGPLLGAIAANGVKVWIRADSPAAWQVKVWPSGESELSSSALRIEGPPLTAASDFTATAQIVGLTPRRSYEYSVALRSPAVTNDAEPAARGVFHTLAPDGEPTRTRVVVGADITGSGPQPIFRQIREVNPDFVLMIGDQVYADAAEPTRDGYAYFYRRNWNIKYLRPMLQNVPAFMIWDDHEIEDNYWQGKSDRYAPAREAYELYVQAHNPAPYRSDVLYYTLRSGDVAFFVLDVRSDRSSNKLPDDEYKSMLGAQQKRDLIDWLTCEPAKLKLIVSPVIWNDWSTTGDDAWVAYTTEREELLGYIASEQIGDVLFLSGDQHWSAVFRYLRDDYAFYEFLPTPLSKTRGTAPGAVTDEILGRDDDNFVYGVVDIDTTQEPINIALTVCALDKPCRPGEERGPGTGVDLEGERENVPFTIHLTGRDLGRQH